MKPYFKLAIAVLSLLTVTLLAGCATLGVPTPQTFEERLASAETTLTTAISTATVLLQAEKINLADAKQIREQLGNASTGLDIARTLHQQDPVGGESKLTSVLLALTALDAYLQSRNQPIGKKPDAANHTPKPLWLAFLPAYSLLR